MNTKIENYLKNIEKYKDDFLNTERCSTVKESQLLQKIGLLNYIVINTDKNKIETLSIEYLRERLSDFEIIGVTGKSGAGKTSFCKKIKCLGRKIVNADEIAHAMLKKNYLVKKEIVSYFGKNILDEKGEIARPKLKKAVINSKIGLAKLNKIMFTPLASKIVLNIKKHLLHRKKIILDAPLLIQYNLHKICDFIIFLTYSGNRSKWK